MAQIYILSGKDQFRRKQKLNQLKKEFLSPGMEALCFASLKDPSLPDFQAAVQSPGFAMGSKVVVVEDMSLLENKSTDKEVAMVLACLENLPDNVILIFNSEKVSGTIKLVKSIKKQFKDKLEHIEFKAFNSWETKQAAHWLMSLGLSELDLGVAEYLAEHIGCEESGKLYSELERLSLLNKKITPDLIKQECKARHDVFKFISKLANGSKAAANSELEKLIAEKELHLGTMAVLQSSLSKFLKLKHAQTQGLSQNQQAEIVGITPQRLYYQSKECSSMQLEHLEKLLDCCLEQERNIKTGRLDLESAFRVLINTV